jgi:dTDP-glucose 4,6-dehydratase
MTKKYAVLGGGGSFGIHTSKYLLDNADTDRVLGIGRAAAKPEPFTLNVGAGDPRYSYHAYHVTHELDLLLELLDRERPNVIVNYAAQGEGAVSWKNSWRFFETNSMALARLTEELAKRDYLERFIQIGTSELYGAVDFPATEDTPLKPTSPYAASKAAFDLHLLAVSKVLDFPMNIIRPSNAYCPGQLLHRVVPRPWSGSHGRKLPLQGGGRAEKSYIHARDLARACLLVADSAPLGTVYNAGPPQPISIRALVEKVAEALDMPFEELCELAPDRQGQDSRYWLDSSAIKRDVGWEPEISLEEGLQGWSRGAAPTSTSSATGRPTTRCAPDRRAWPRSTCCAATRRRGATSRSATRRRRRRTSRWHGVRRGLLRRLPRHRLRRLPVRRPVAADRRGRRGALRARER